MTVNAASADPVQVSSLTCSTLMEDMTLLQWPVSPQVQFHGVVYTVRTAVVDGESLTVEIEQLSEASRWRGEFSAQCNLASDITPSQP